MDDACSPAFLAACSIAAHQPDAARLTQSN